MEMMECKNGILPKLVDIVHNQWLSTTQPHNFHNCQSSPFIAAYIGSVEMLLIHWSLSHQFYEINAELQNVNFFTQIISVQLDLPQEKVAKSQRVFDI